MIFVNVDDPVRDVWDTGVNDMPFFFERGARLIFTKKAGSMAGRFEVVATVRDVVLVRRVPS